ncbi:MAG: outer membrane beta-barrel protein [Verrucomicrobiota bacterium]
MKFNKWTLGLAAVGAVSLASAVRADEATTPKLVPLTTALSSTVISGYVDVAAQYNIGNYGPGAGVPVGTSGTGIGSGNKIDNFSFNDVDIAFDKPEDESPWASGYHIDLNAGTDAVGVGINGSQAPSAAGTATAAIRQAYVVVRTPVGNGIDWKAGIQDDIIGYEGNTDGGNPNYTRSIGYSVEPTTLLGLIGSYKIVDAVTVQAGIVDALSPLGTSLVSPWPANSSDKTFAGAIAFTAPDSFGWAKGATLNLGTLINVDKGGQDNWYAGLTIPTPISALKLGAAADLVSQNNGGVNPITGLNNSHNDSGWVLGLYGSVQATDKLSFNVRGEYYDLSGSPTTGGPVYLGTDGKGEEVTATIQYNLWANVTSRLEFRWDHIDSGDAFANGGADADSFLLAANLIYTF